MHRRGWRLVSSVLMVTLAFVFRIRNLGEASLWTDEGGTIFAVRQPASGMINYLLDDAVHPPLFFFIQKTALGLGVSEFVLRWPAAMFGVLSVAATMRVGREWLGRSPALVGAVFLALTPYAAWYSREVRMYTLVMLLSLGAMWAFGRLLTSTRRTETVLFTLLSTSLYTTHYFGLYAPLIQFVYLLITFRQNHRILVRWLICQVMASLAIGAWLAMQYSYGVTLKITWIQYPNPTALLGTLVQFTTGGSAAWQWVAGSLCGVIAALGVWSVRKQWAMWLVVLWICLPMLVTYAISLRRPLYVDRYFLSSLPPLMLAMAAGVVHLGRLNRLAGITLVVAIALMMTQQTVSGNAIYRENWRGASQFLVAHEQEGDQLLRRSVYYRAMDYYYYGALDIKSMDVEWQVPSLLPSSGRLWLFYIENEAHHGSRDAMLVDLYHQAPDLSTLDWLKRIEPYLQEWREFDGVNVLLYDFSMKAPQ